MKDRYESAELFTAYATVEAATWMLGELLKEITKPVSPIIAMVDQVTGKAASDHKQQCKYAIDILKEVIEAKKVIGIDVSTDEAMVKDLKSRIKGNHTNPHA